MLITTFSFFLALAVRFRADAFIAERGFKNREQVCVAVKNPVSFVPSLPEIPDSFRGLIPGSKPASDGNLNENELKFDPSPEGLAAQAKRFLSTDMLDPSFLDDDRFQWIGPYVDKPLDKTDYLAAGRFFDLRSAFPDLNYRAHDFRVDDDDPSTIRFTCRTVGTMRGELRLRDTVLAPTGKTMRCPPEAVSITFDRSTGKITKLCTGFCLDRLVGNTEGTTGVLAAALIGGQPISDWEIYPPAAVLKRFFGRPVEPLPEPTNFLAPFPETVMVQLAKGVILSNMGAQDPSLLADDFTYCTPTLGPIRKKEFLEKYAREEFRDIDPFPSNFRVDPYDPERVWVDIEPAGPAYQGAPQAMSFTFDKNGFCTRVTAGAVMDPTLGNGGGLGGPDGLKYARGEGVNVLTARPLPRFLGRLKNSLLEPLFGSQPRLSVLASTKGLLPAAKPEAPSSSLTKFSSTPTINLLPQNPIEVPKFPSLSTINLLQLDQKATLPKPPVVPPADSEKKNLSPLEQLSATLGSISLRQTMSTEEAEAARKKASEKMAAEVKAKRSAGQSTPPKEPQSPLDKLVESFGTINLRQIIPVEDVDAARKDASQKRAAEARRDPKAPPQAPPQINFASPLEKLASFGSINLRQSKSPEDSETERKKAAEKRAAEAKARQSEQEKQRLAALQAQKLAKEKALKEKEALQAQQEKQRKAALEAQKAAELRKAQQEKQKAMAAEQEKKRQAALDAEKAAKEKAAAEARKAEQERKRIAALESQKESEQEKRRLEAERAAAEARKAEQEKRRLEAEKAAADARRAEQEKQRLAALEAQKLAKEKAVVEARKAEQERQRFEEAKKAARDKALKEIKEAEARKAAQEKEMREKQERMKSDAAQKQRQAEELKEKKQKEQASLATLTKSASRGTIALFGFNKNAALPPATPTKQVSVKKAPPGVPSLSGWRKNSDGSVSGRVSGARNFRDGEKITTSPIAKGVIATGEVVTTGSGSRYFLE